MKNHKTVYILGAGFSMDAGAPSQFGIIEEIYKLKSAYKEHKQEKKVSDWVDKFDTFLRFSLKVSEEQKYWYALEDIYTPIDKSIKDGTSFAGYTATELIKFRDIFNKLIILAVRNSIKRKNKNNNYIEEFANHLVKLSEGRTKNEKQDSVSVITTNWDIMLDNLTYRIIDSQDKPKGLDFSGVVDYCCYISSLDENDHSIKPGLYALGKGRYNVKILKLHGSLNWLQCPKCQRLYVKFYKRWNGGYVFDKMHCRHCVRNFSTTRNSSNQLMTNLTMPTFLKNFDNVQNKLIWQNAGIELSEADKVVFIGYSLPQADFELKQLLSRMIKASAKIETVLIESDDPSKHSETSKYNTAGYRYENFFSGRELKIYYGGVIDYINKNCN